MTQARANKTTNLRKKSLSFGLKLGVTAGALWFLFSRVNLQDFLPALRRISAGPVVLVVALQMLNYYVGTLRWRHLLAAYGAAQVPARLPLFRIYMVGAFYNTYLPGAVSGDVLRGYVSRSAFAEDGTTRGVAVVFLDRLLGLWGLLSLSSLSIALFTSGEFYSRTLPWVCLALLGLSAAILLLSQGPRFVGLLPQWAPRAWVLRLPQLKTVRPFVLALVLSLGGHVVSAYAGHTLVQAASAHVKLQDSLVIMPLAGAAAYFPFTIAGAGARDLAMVKLYYAWDYTQEAALAGSLALLFCTFVSAGLGGLLQLFYPLTLAPGSVPKADDPALGQQP